MARKIEVQILGDSTSIERAFGRSSKAATGFTGKLSATFGTLAKSTAVVEATSEAIRLGAEGVRGVIDVWKDNAEASAQTAAVMKSTGSAAGISAGHISELAESLRKQTGISKASIQGSENILLGFTKIRDGLGKNNDIFDRATKVIQDYSVRTGRSATSASIVFGRALQDPAKNLGALGRVGIKFTDGQIKQIKALEASGKLMAAQKIVVKELETRYGGAAAAAGKTLPGQLRILKGSLEEQAATLLTKVTPALTDFATFANKNIPVAIQAIGQAWRQYGAPIFENVKQVVKSVTEAAEAFWEHFGSIITTVAKNDLGGALTIVKDLLGAIAATFKLFADILHGHWGAAWGDLKTIVRDSLGAVFALIKTALKNFAAIGAALGHALADAMVAALKGLGKLVVALVKAPINLLIDEINAIKLPKFKVDTHIPGVGKISSPAIDPIPHIPRLATGGLVTSRTLALIGESGPELVLPLKVLLRGLGTSTRMGGGDIVFHHQTILDGQVVERSVTRHQQKRARSNPQQKRGPAAANN